MLETLSKRVTPSEEQSMIEVMACFGWRVKSSQEINSKESHLERRGDEIYSVTSKENYVKLLFERDTDIPNYSKIVLLERQYNACLAELRPKFNAKKILITLALLLFLPPVGIGYGVYSFYKSVKQARGNFAEKVGPILYEARSLL